MRPFPVLIPYRDRQSLRDRLSGKFNCPTEIDWALIAPHEQQVKRNHGQSLERLAERGGLSPLEIYLAMTGRGLFDHGDFQEETDLAVKFVNALAQRQAA